MRSPYPFLKTVRLLSAGLFFLIALTSFHEEFQFLAPLHLEVLLFLLAVGSAFVAKEGSPLSDSLLVAACLLISAPIITSLFYHREEALFLDPEFQTWTKSVLVGAPLALAFRRIEDKRVFFWLLNVSCLILAAIFLYRYRILGEVRDFDLRPKLATKNGDPNFMCTIFGFFLPFLCYQLKHSRLPLLLIPLTLYCALLTESRMGLIAVMAGFLFLVSYLVKQRRYGLVVGIAMIALIPVVSGLAQTSVERFNQMNDVANHERVQTLQNGWKLFSENPFFGHGWGASTETYYQNSKFPPFQSEHPPLQVHDLPLQVLAELGFFGACAFFFLWLTVGKTVLKTREKDPALFYASLAALTGLLLNSLTLPLETKDFLLLLLFSVAVLNDREARDQVGELSGAIAPGAAS